MHKIVQYILLGLLMAASVISNAQELKCQVNVNARQVEGSEKLIFSEMESAIFKFVNGNKWTNDKYESEEKIECSILITLEERVSNNQFKGNIQVQASRPTYNSGYNSPIMNIRDEKFVIKYSQFEPLIFNKTSYGGELSSILGFYIYMILGYDYDSFSMEGGTRYFQEAQRIVNNAQSSPETGWKASEDQNNRYWLVENALSARFKPLRRAYYNYHRKGMDIMNKDLANGRKQITQSLKDLKAIHDVAPSSFNMKVFFNAKMREIVNIYQPASPAEKNEITELLITIDPGNTNNYNKILK